MGLELVTRTCCAVQSLDIFLATPESVKQLISFIHALSLSLNPTCDVLSINMFFYLKQGLKGENISRNIPAKNIKQKGFPLQPTITAQTPETSKPAITYVNK